MKFKVSDWKEVTPYFVFCCLIFNVGNLLFGYDTFSFGSLQTLPSFLATFGEPQPDGSYALSTSRKSIMTSVQFSGKIVGCAVFEPLLERFGYKKTAYILAVVQIIAIIVELTSGEWIQFTVGRVLAYAAAGMAEPIVPTYLAELSPAPLRGFFAGNVAAVVQCGAIWGAAMNRAYVYEESQKGWMVPTAMMMIPGVILLAGVPFCVESPRWLIVKGRKDEAVSELNRIRPLHDKESGKTAREADAWEEAIAESRQHTEGTWPDMFGKRYLNRTLIVTLVFWFQQTGGQQFANSYAPTLFGQIGLDSASTLNFTIVQACCGFAGSMIAVFTTDIWGRRVLCYVGAALAVAFGAVIGDVGSAPDIATDSMKSNAVVASTVLLFASTKFGASSQCWLIASEIGGTQMRKKMMGYGIVIDVVAAFLVAFCTPYLMDAPGVTMGAEVAYVYMVMSALSFFFFIFWVPEFKGRSLEEVDELFERGLWAWEFEKAQTYGIGARIAAMEAGHSSFSEPEVVYNEALTNSSQEDTTGKPSKSESDQAQK